MKKLLFILIIISSTLLAGCQNNPLLKPSELLEKSALKEYVKYVNNDPNLTPEQKARRLQGIKDYVRLLKDTREVEGY